MQLTLEQIDVIKRLIDANPDHMQYVTTAAGIEEAFANGKGCTVFDLCISFTHKNSTFVDRWFGCVGPGF